MASIRPRRRADGTTSWAVLYRADGGRQTSKTFGSDQAARRFARLVDELGPEEALEVQRAREGADADTPTLRAWCFDYIAGLTGVTDGTRARYRRHAEIHLGHLAELPIDAVTVKAIGVWVNRQVAEGAAGKTIANRHGFLSGALGSAVRHGLITSNPCDGTRLPKTERREMTHLTGDEFAVLLTYVRPDAQDLVATLAATGLRWGEATALQARDVDVDAGTLTVSRAWKWHPDGSMVLGPPKTTRSRRTIALPPQIAAMLQDRVFGAAPDALVFPNLRGEPWKLQAFHSAVWQPAVRLSNGEPPVRNKPRGKGPARVRVDGQPWRVRTSPRTPAPVGQRLGKRPRVHDLRHTCASWMIRAGVPLPVIQRHLGHESITTTIDRYGHLEPAHLAMAAGALGQALGPALPEIEGPAA